MHLILVLSVISAAGSETPRAESVPYGVASWPAQLGNHRAVVEVERPAKAILVELPWRRRDSEPEKKAVLVFDAATGKRITNAVAASMTQARGEIVFQPSAGPGKYYVYYMPLSRPAEESYGQAEYARPQETADAAWRSSEGLTAEALKTGAWRGLPRGKLLGWESRDEYDKFTSMERSAGPEEVAQLLAAAGQAPYLVFPEDRRNPIRMRDAIAKRWIDAGVRNVFEGKACRGEFYAFQIGVFAACAPIADLAIAAEDLRPRSASARPIPASAIRCFNQGGIDTNGRAFRRTISIEQGKVLALWFGVQVPPDAQLGPYDGAIRVGPQGAPGTRVALPLEVEKTVLPDAGDSEPWRHSRLRWLDSTIAGDDQPAAPFTPLVVEGRRIACLGRDLELDASGLPASVRSQFAPEVTRLVTPGREMLAGPMRFVAEFPDGKAAAFDGGSVEFLNRSAGRIAWKSGSGAGPLRLRCQAEMESDGHLAFTMQVTADRPVPVSDLRLEIPLRREAARYMIGMGRPGGLRPAEHTWKWDRKNNQDSIWLGDVNAGLRCRLYGENYRRPLINIHYHHGPLNLPPAWHNEGRGGCTVREEAAGCVVLRATSGTRTVRPGQPLQFNFALLLTPTKPLDTDRHWASRYYHAYHPPGQVAQTGANIVNIHHGTEIHPYINYPFLHAGKLKQYVDEAHAKGLKVKIYYTAREQSNHTAELWALRSLGDEVLAPGPGGGHTWLQEHLDPPYVRGWYTPATHDVAFITNGDTRWHNYYLEGLDWLVRNVGIDGLYIDDLSYDRTVMKRARKILDRRRPGSQIDLHSWNHFNDLAGHACCLDLYMEHLPYIDRVWIGEGRDYNTPPDYWLVEISGIPFGVMGEMLEGGGNPWRGMIYGMTGRLPYMADPRPIWKVWDDFGMAGSQMIGYWADCPVRTDSASVLATVYRKPSKALVAVASWAAKKVDCRLTIDFSRLGLDRAKTRLRAPAVPGFQPAASFRPSDPIPIDPGRGWLLVLERED
jgi:hypothetical protein